MVTKSLVLVSFFFLPLLWVGPNPWVEFSAAMFSSSRRPRTNHLRKFTSQIHLRWSNPVIGQIHVADEDEERMERLGQVTDKCESKYAIENQKNARCLHKSTEGRFL